MKDVEFWLPVINFEGYYECSNTGKIRSVGRIIEANKVRGEYFRSGIELALTTINPDGYIMVTLYKGSKKSAICKTAHYFIFYTFNPLLSPKSGFEIDHIDNNKLNLRPDNLRLITSRKNSTKRSLQKPKSSQYTGVSFSNKSQKWYASIRVNGKSKSLGLFDNELDAAIAYQNKLASITN